MSCTGVVTLTPAETPSALAMLPVFGSMARTVKGSPAGTNGRVKKPVESAMAVNGARRSVDPCR